MLQDRTECTLDVVSGVRRIEQIADQQHVILHSYRVAFQATVSRLLLRAKQSANIRFILCGATSSWLLVLLLLLLFSAIAKVKNLKLLHTILLLLLVERVLPYRLMVLRMLVEVHRFVVFHRFKQLVVYLMQHEPIPVLYQADQIDVRRV